MTFEELTDDILSWLEEKGEVVHEWNRTSLSFWADGPRESWCYIMEEWEREPLVVLDDDTIYLAPRLRGEGFFDVIWKYRKMLPVKLEGTSLSQGGYKFLTRLGYEVSISSEAVAAMEQSFSYALSPHDPDDEWCVLHPESLTETVWVATKTHTSDT